MEYSRLGRMTPPLIREFVAEKLDLDQKLEYNMSRVLRIERLSFP